MSAPNVLDGTWVLPGAAVSDAYHHEMTGRIDTDAIKALPVEARWTAAIDPILAKAGVTPGDAWVFDRAGLFSAPWVAWLLRSRGLKADILEAGWSGDAPTEATPSAFTGQDTGDRLNITKEELLSNLGQVQIIDARPSARFAGTDPEPRAGLRSGHIPGSLSVPFGSIKSGASFLSDDDLRHAFRGVDFAKPIVTSCGSGVTASGLAMALTRIGAEDVRVYQGSWSEWGADPDLPLETGHV